MQKSFKIRRLSIRIPIVALVATGVALLGGVAFATWTATGSGNGYAKATTAQNLVFNDISATVTGTLFPGATGLSYSYQIHNPNPYSVTVTSVTLPSTGALVTVIPSGTCTQANSGVSYTAPGTLATPISLAANGSSGDTASETFAGVSMSTASDNSCQGATFGLALIASGQSS
jgi:hypothetical protein